MIHLEHKPNYSDPIEYWYISCHLVPNSNIQESQSWHLWVNHLAYAYQSDWLWNYKGVTFRVKISLMPKKSKVTHLCQGCSSKGREYNKVELKEILISITIKVLCCDDSVFLLVLSLLASARVSFWIRKAKVWKVWMIPSSGNNSMSSD